MTQTLLYQLLFVCLSAYTLTRFEPLQGIVEWLRGHIQSSKNILVMLIGIPATLIFEIIACTKCASLWLGLIYFTAKGYGLEQTLFYSMICSFTMVIFEKTIGKWINTIRLN